MNNSILFFKEINERLKKIKLNNIKGPQFTIKDGDIVVGKMDKKHKKLWILKERLAEEGKKIFQQNKVKMVFWEVSKSFPGGENLDDIQDQLAELIRLIEIVDRILWFEIRKDFNLWTKPFVAIKKGWKVVWREEEKDASQILKFLEDLTS